MPTIQSLLNSQGDTPQQQSAITQQRLGASNTAFDALREKAANRTAATNNSADYGDLTAQPAAQPASACNSRKAPVRRRRLLRPHRGARFQRQRNLLLRSSLSVRTIHTSLAIQCGDHGQVIGSMQPVLGGAYQNSPSITAR
jgi:hypothetical protein